MEKFIKYAGVVALVIVAILVVLPKAQSIGSSANGGNVTDFTAVNTDDGYFVDATQIINGSGQFIGTIVAAARAAFDGGVLHSYTNATSTTVTSYTLTQADILNYETVLFTPNTASITLTLPASSTLTSLVPSAGDWQEQCWYNATSTAAINITFAAGVGIDLERTATSTTSGSAGVLAIGPRNSACLKYIRETDTDVTVQMHNFIDAD